MKENAMRRFMNRLFQIQAGAAGVTSLLAGSLLALALCLMLPGQPLAQNLKAPDQSSSRSDYRRLVGKWQRPDGGYVLEITGARPNGQLIAAYFNPKPINVSKAEWRWMGDGLLVFVELQDANYPGSTYTLAYFPEEDKLKGTYYQALLDQRFTVVFTRMK